MPSVGRKVPKLKPVTRDILPVGADDRSDATGSFVLPRFLRRPVRTVRRYLDRGVRLSVRSFVAFAIIAVGGAGFVGLLESGNAHTIAARASLIAGFQINDVKINGAKEVSRIDVLTNIDLGTDRSLFAFDAHQAREDLKQLPWVFDARVTKAYPDTIVVSIVEREPFAVWQRGEVLTLIARDGTEIAPFDDLYSHLPLVVGAGANESAARIISQARRHPMISSKVKAFVRVGDRRWNLVLDDDLTVLLPENREALELNELARLEREEGLFSRALDQVDMRLADRLVLRLTPAGKDIFEVQSEARLKAMNAGGSSI